MPSGSARVTYTSASVSGEDQEEVDHAAHLAQAARFEVLGHEQHDRHERQEAEDERDVLEGADPRQRLEPDDPVEAERERGEERREGDRQRAPEPVVLAGRESHRHDRRPDRPSRARRRRAHRRQRQRSVRGLGSARRPRRESGTRARRTTTPMESQPTELSSLIACTELSIRRPPRLHGFPAPTSSASYTVYRRTKAETTHASGLLASARGPSTGTPASQSSSWATDSSRPKGARTASHHRHPHPRLARLRRREGRRRPSPTRAR